MEYLEVMRISTHFVHTELILILNNNLHYNIKNALEIKMPLKLVFLSLLYW